MEVRELPPNILVEISLLLLDNDSFDYENPFDDYETNETVLQSSSNWAGAYVGRDDVEFMCKFIKDNLPLLNQVKNGDSNTKEILSEIRIPEAKKYKVYYEISGRAILTEEYTTNWDCYDEDWVEASLKQSYYDGSFDYYQGDYVDHEVDDFETDDIDITSVNAINEGKRTLLSKIVVENTTDVVDSLDKDTLIRLRNIINQRLSSF